jgi:hypothetical protein
MEEKKPNDLILVHFSVEERCRYDMNVEMTRDRFEYLTKIGQGLGGESKLADELLDLVDRDNPTDFSAEDVDEFHVASETKCTNCDGEGRTPVKPLEVPEIGTFMTSLHCVTCNGEGWVNVKDCDSESEPDAEEDADEENDDPREDDDPSGPDGG